MPELPEVETTRRGIEPHLTGQVIEQVVVRHSQLRWPVPDLNTLVSGLKIIAVQRRAKYLLLQTEHGHLIIHLGMSGHLRLVNAQEAPQKHDHIDLHLSHQKILRYHDPRRFGAWLWTEDAPEQHPLLAKLAPEPLSAKFNAEYVWQRIQRRKVSIKNWLMNAQQVVGVGNIYANESLFLAAIHPQRLAASLSYEECERLVSTIKQVLNRAIEQGGTTLKDFLSPDGKPGYFAQALYVYGRADQPCLICANPIQRCVQQQRASYFCPHCQKLKA